jgi:Kef-type K+ transport system membrane component KefB
LVLFIVFVAVITLWPLMLRRIQIPGVIALLIAGMLIGPNCFDLVQVLANAFSFLGGDPDTVVSHFDSLINSFGSLGLVFLMALAGMEADFKLIRSVRTPVILLSIFTFLIPAITGFWIYQYFRPDDFSGKLLYASLFASHSVGIVFPVIRELKLTKTRFGASVLISTVVTDIASIILLAVSVQIKRQSLEVDTLVGNRTLSLFDYIEPAMFGHYFTPIFLLIVLCYLGISVYFVSKLGRFLLRIFKPGEDALITILLLVILATVLFGEFLGVNLVVGAFIAGLALSRLVKENRGPSGPLMHRFESIGYGLLIPFLFISIGMATDFSAFGETGNISIIGMTVLGLVFSKIFSGWLALRLSGFPDAKGVCAGLMTVPQLSATLAAAAIGKNLGMLDNNFFNAIIILSIVTTLPIPTLVRLIIIKTNMKFTEDTEEVCPIPEAEIQDELI